MLHAPYKLAIINKTIAVRFLSEKYPIYIVNEYPKSGGTWVKNMLAHSINIPAWNRELSPYQSCVMQGHWIRPRAMVKPLIVYRDGRDVMISFYYHSFFYNDLLNGVYVDRMKSQLKFDDYSDIKSNLLTFMKFVFETPVSPRFSWTKFVDVWHGRPDKFSVRYEDLRLNTPSELRRILQEICPEKNWTIQAAEATVEAFKMENMQKKQASLNKGIYGKQTAEVPFIRSGSVGGWSQHFTDESLEWFEKKAGQQLLKLGYKLGRS